MEQSNILLYFLAGVAGLFALLVIVYLVIRKKLQSSEMREIQKLREGTQAKKHTSEILYQKLYVRYIRIPFLKRYLLHKWWIFNNKTNCSNINKNITFSNTNNYSNYMVDA